MEMKLPRTRRAAGNPSQFTINPRVRERLQRRFLALIAGAPRGRLAVVHRWVDQFQTAAFAAGRRRPLATRFIMNGIRKISPLIFKANQFARVAQGAGQRTKNLSDARVMRRHVRRLACHHRITTRGQQRPRRKRIINAARHAPTRKVYRRRTAVKQFHILARRMRGRWAIHDFIDDDRFANLGRIGRIPRRDNGMIPLGASQRKPLHRRQPGPRRQLDRIQDRQIARH